MNFFGMVLQMIVDFFKAPGEIRRLQEGVRARKEAEAKAAAIALKKATAWKKTIKGRVVYEHEKHYFQWQRASKIVWALIGSEHDIPYHLRDRYYARMRSAYIGYGYAMLRMYPGFAESYLLGIAKSQDTKEDEFRTAWRKITLDIVEYGLNAFIPEFGGAEELKLFLKVFAERYYDWLFSL